MKKSSYFFICKNCKYWRFIRNENIELHSEIIWYGPHGICYRIDELSNEKDDKAWTSIYCICGSRYGDQESSLITKPDFGCILFEDKNEKM